MPLGWSGHPSPGPRDCHAVKASFFFLSKLLAVLPVTAQAWPHLSRRLPDGVTPNMRSTGTSARSVRYSERFGTLIV